MKTEPLYSFVFKGILTKEALSETEAKCTKSLAKIEDEDIYKLLCIDELPSELVIKAKKMSHVFTAICSFENSIRELITQIFFEEIGSDWWEKRVPKKIKDKAESRKEEEDKIKWHTQRGDNYINYTEFGDLVSIMRGDNWDFFEPHIISLEWAQQIIKTLERSRNVIMHSGELSDQDLARIGTLIRDWVRQVGV
ncbi:hypothetical protein EMN47_19200 [Prolixibacteraceae bacterium JC049]|nr:hypothetical protein [Prolixibacteraceae bacterium JC049]